VNNAACVHPPTIAVPLTWRSWETTAPTHRRQAPPPPPPEPVAPVAAEPEPEPEPAVPPQPAVVAAPTPSSAGAAAMRRLDPAAAPVAAVEDVPSAALAGDDDDPELAAALAMSMQAEQKAPAAVVVPKTSRPAPVGATTVKTRVIKTGAEETLAVPEGTGVMMGREFRQLVAAVHCIPIGSIMLVAGGKQLRDDQTLADGGVNEGVVVFVGVNPAGGAPPTLASASSTSSSAARSTASAASALSSASAASSSSSSAAAASSSSPGKDAMVLAMTSAITTMKAATDYVSLIAAVRTVVKLVGNLIDHPGDAKYSKVRCCCPMFYSYSFLFRTFFTATSAPTITSAHNSIFSRTCVRPFSSVTLYWPCCARHPPTCVSRTVSLRLAHIPMIV
jgi:hypothetical protein